MSTESLTYEGVLRLFQKSDERFDKRMERLEKVVENTTETVGALSNKVGAMVEKLVGEGNLVDQFREL